MRKEYIAWFSQGKHGESTMPMQELVRCRDCRYFGNKVRIHDTYVCNKLGVYMPMDGYCSEGKVKK